MKSDKLYWATDLRAFATLAVIVLHVASTISLEYPDIPKSYFLTSVFTDSFVRWCVPIFIMLSGTFALDKYDGQLKKFFIKMFYRIILPFLFWSVVYLFFFSWKEISDPIKSVQEVSSFIARQFIIGTASHLWFVYVIVSLYLTFPFLSKWTKVATEKEYLYFLSLWILFLVIEPYVSKFDTSLDFSYFSGYLGYIVLGSYLFKTDRKPSNILLFFLFLAGFLYTAIRSYYISVQTNENSEVFQDNLSLNIFLMSLCVYLFFKNRKAFSNPVMRKLIDTISTHSYGIYLSHLLILNIFLSIGLNFSFIHPILSIPLISITSLFISCTLVILMKRIPVLKMLAG